MNYNKPDTKLNECIFILKKIIPSDLCDYIIGEIETRPWQPHLWYNPLTDSNHSEETKELDIQNSSEELHKMLSTFILKAGKEYNLNYCFGGKESQSQIIHKFCPIRFNRYSTGQIMRPHFDHIHDIFDGEKKGVPVLSFILNFNDDYEGGDLYFWKDNMIKLGKGDIVMFPSNFLFPHGVTEIIKGKRYSAVTWAW